MNSPDQPEPIAIVALSGRFPGAATVEELWDKLRRGEESLRPLTDEQLIAAGVDPAQLAQPAYVKSAMVLDGVDRFDAGFFGFNPREAEILDPQHRLFLECSWEALERAGYDPARFPGSIAVFAGVGQNAYFLSNLMTRPDLVESVGGFQTMIGNNPDFVASRVSYKLDLRGPSLSVQTGCSSSLVAIHLACQSLLTGESDMALAGGVSINVPQDTGYLYQEGGIGSPDGHCRAFDADAHGTVGASGVAIVVLKRLTDALADRDTIHAVIRGSAINNDGSNKVGFTAPSVDGQAQVIGQALGMAEVDAGSVQYIEAHGTGTTLGDPIEVAALKKAFHAHGADESRCALGSLKTNIGHLDTAAGAAGLIKTVLALENQLLPPTLHFKAPNPKIDLQRGPFYVSAEPREWPAGATPRRAGVSSFGIGGTNAHVVLEEAPKVEPSSGSRPRQLLVLSARSHMALEQATDRLAAFLGENPRANLADVAFTLQEGRRAFEHRRVLVARSIEEARTALSARDPKRVFTQAPELRDRPVVFLFPGQGSQHVNMGRELYQLEPTFRDYVDRASEILRPMIGRDLRTLLFPADGEVEEATRQLTQTGNTQPALFVIEYALAQLWMELGIRPQAMVGHSIGEYVAACLAGVFSFEDALALVAARGQMMQSLPSGSMLSIPLSEDETLARLSSRLSLAVVNSPTSCVAAGPEDEIAALDAQLTKEGIASRRLHTSHAFHSKMMDPILDEFARRVAKVRLSRPKVPYLSNVSGTWINAHEATDPGYWARHLREPVRFAKNLAALFTAPERVLLEVGPGRTLGALARQAAPAGTTPAVLPSLSHPQDRQSDLSFLLGTLGRLWISGVSMEWNRLYARERRQRVVLPTYPFERERYWIDARKPSANEAVAQPKATLRKRSDVTDWFYLPAWKQSRLPAAPRRLDGQRWAVLVDAGGVGQRVAQRLEALGAHVTKVSEGDSFQRSSDRELTIDPRDPAHYTRLLDELGGMPDKIVHLWSAGSWSFEHQQTVGFYGLTRLAQAIAARDGRTQIAVVTTNLHLVTGDESLSPDKATLLGPCKVIPVEHPQIACRAIDLTRVQGPQLDRLVAELVSDAREPVVAYRGTRRFVETHEAAPLAAADTTRLRERGVYLITGGLGKMGLATAELLAKKYRARLVLAGRSSFPERDEWEAWLAAHDANDPTSRKIVRLLAMESAGAELLIARTDISDRAQLDVLLARAQLRFGELHGVIHAAADLGDHARVTIADASHAACDSQFAAKVRGTMHLGDALRGRPLDFVLLASSIATVTAGAGFAAYAAANQFLDAFAQQQSQLGATPWISVGWDGWHFDEEGPAQAGDSAMNATEGLDVFERILAAQPVERWLISTAPLEARLAAAQPRLDEKASAPAAKREEAPAAGHRRPSLANEYLAPRDSIERAIADLWEALLGISPVGVHDNFFDLGGHSLLGTQVMSRLREGLQVDLPVRCLFEGPTVAELAAAVMEFQVAQLGAETVEGLVAELEASHV
jgi:acyl transferase domain-containing protein